MIRIAPITHDLSAADRRSLEQLFIALYDHLATSGLRSGLAEHGAEQWANSVVPMLGKLTFLIGAWEGDELLGFTAGTLRTLPPHLKGLRYGALTHIFVHERIRGAGTARRLCEALTAQFREKDVSFMETDVLPGNPESREMFEKLGFEVDHLILRRKS